MVLRVMGVVPRTAGTRLEDAAAPLCDLVIAMAPHCHVRLNNAT